MILLALQTAGFGASLVSYPPTSWQQLPKWCRYRIPNSLRFWRCTPTWLWWDTWQQKGPKTFSVTVFKYQLDFTLEPSLSPLCPRAFLHKSEIILHKAYLSFWGFQQSAQKNGQNMVWSYFEHSVPTGLATVIFTKEVKVLDGSRDLVGG